MQVIGDGVLTPAISVVSAVQGLSIKTNVTQDSIIGISVAILVGLCLRQCTVWTARNVMDRMYYQGSHCCYM